MGMFYDIPKTDSMPLSAYLDQYSLEAIFLHESVLSKNKYATSKALREYLKQSKALLRNEQFAAYMEQRCKRESREYLEQIHHKYQPYKLKLWQALSKKIHDKTISPDELVTFLSCIHDFEMILLEAKIQKGFADKNSKIEQLKSMLCNNRIVTACLALITIGYVYATYPSKDKKENKQRGHHDHKKISHNNNTF